MTSNIFCIFRGIFYLFTFECYNMNTFFRLGDFMNAILPYERNLATSDGAYIMPNGKFIYPFNGHEMYAHDYCNGKYFYELNRVRQDALSGCLDELSISDEYWNHLKKMLGYTGERKDVDIYLSSKLNQDELKLYKLWMQEYEFTKNHLYSDFLNFVLGFDKVDTIMRHGISTTSPTPHVRFFNYYLMGWNVWVHPLQVFDEKTGAFFSIPRNNNHVLEDREAEEEIEELKAKVLKKDLIHFLK